MTIQPFLHNAKSDLLLRKHFALPYLFAYGLAFLTAYSLNMPAPFRVPLFDITAIQRVTAASLWAFMFSYPVLHLLMRSRLFLRYRSISIKIYGMILGAAIVGLLTFFLVQQPGEAPSTRNAKLLHTPFGAAWLQLMAAMALSIGIFLVLEPVRERLRIGR